MKISEAYLSILENVPLFRGIPAEELGDALIRLRASVSGYSAGEYVRLQGDRADFIGIVLSGTVQILKDDIYGNRQLTAVLHAGEMFAEAFVCAGVRLLPVDIYAAQDSSVLFLSAACILGGDSKTAGLHYSACSFRPLLTSNLLQILASKNIFLNRKLQITSCRTTREKLLAYLGDFAGASGSREFTIPLNRQQLADYLGVERSAMSAELGKMQREGLLVTERSHFKLLF